MTSFSSLLFLTVSTTLCAAVKPVKIVDENLYEPVGMTENGLDVYKDSGGFYVYDDYLRKNYLSKKEVKTQVTLYANRKG